MPYLDSKIDKHYKNCFNPVGKRLYIRDYDTEGKQKFVSWGLTCTTCGVVVKEEYERGLTKQERQYFEDDRKLEGGEYSKIVEKFTGRPYGSPEERLERHNMYKIKRKLKRLQRRKLGNSAITPKESGLRTRIRNLKNYFEYMNRYEHSEISWDNALVEQFLNVYPRPTLKELVDIFAPSDSVITVDSKRYSGIRGLFQIQKEKVT